MRRLLKTAAMVIACSLFAGFAADQIIELERYLNARDTADFRRDTPNVKVALAPRTRGKIRSSKRFVSGNFGLEVELMTGPLKGETVWLYYRTSDPGMKLYENDEASAKGIETKAVEKARLAQTTREQAAIREPRRKGLKEGDADQIVRSVSELNHAVKRSGDPNELCPDCQVAAAYSRPTDSASPRPQKGNQVLGSKPNPTSVTRSQTTMSQLLIAPSRDVNPYGNRSAGCRHIGADVNACTYEGDREPGYFKFRNVGPNRVVTKVVEGRFREWSFVFEARARQDLGLAIEDAPNGNDSQSQYSYLMFFPRTTLPSVRTQGGRQLVTLPTGELVTFDTRTKQVLGGALAETGSMTMGGKGGQPAKVSYQGNGIVVRVDAVGKEPRQAARTATISKQGRTCQVPAKALWPDRRESAAPHFKFATDAEFDRYLRSACGFGL